jgi:UPF0755 protein
VKRLLVAVSFLVTLALVGGALAVAYGLKQYRAAGPLEQRTIVRIEPGSGVRTIANRLAQAGVIEHPLLFVAAARLTDSAGRLKAGEFAFPAHASTERALDILVSGKTVARKLTVPEGLTSREILQLVRAAEGLEGEIEAVPAQGTLLPETYHYRYGDARSDLIARMRAAQDALLDELWPERAEDLPYDDKRAAVILASIVEGETAVAGERALVAGVFVNRLERGMRLQSDPTVRYALTEGERELGRPLTRQDWKLEHPYNTYRIDGLPPGPINHPGRKAIEAALDPAETDYLYFVADGTGGHAFAETLREHNRNVAEWRRVRDNQ